MRKVIFFVLTLFLAVTLTACGDGEKTTTDYVRDEAWRTPAELLKDIQSDDVDDSKQISYIEMDLSFRDDNDVAYYGKMKFMLFNEIAPKTVQNFIDLTKDGFYDGLTITRVVTDLLIQGGAYNETANGVEKDAPISIEGEFENNSFSKNVLSHRRGVLSMARVADDNNSASSQFFVASNNFTSCDGDYAAFGWLTTYDVTAEQRLYEKNDKGERVLYDYDCLDKIANLYIVGSSGDNGDGAPISKVVINSVKVCE